MDQVLVWFLNTKCLNKQVRWFSNTKNKPQLVILSNTTRLHRTWFDFRTRSLWIKCGLIFEHELFGSMLVWFSNTKMFDQSWFDFPNTKCLNLVWFDYWTRNVWIKYWFNFRTWNAWFNVGLISEHEVFESKVLWFSNAK